MDVIKIVSDGFNIYFPMAILAFCLATYFSLGSRFLSMLGFQQFLGDDELTTDLVEEGRELIKRGKSNILYNLIRTYNILFSYIKSNFREAKTSKTRRFYEPATRISRAIPRRREFITLPNFKAKYGYGCVHYK